MYTKRICGWSRGCISSPSGHKNRKLISLFFNEIGNYATIIYMFVHWSSMFFAMTNVINPLSPIYFSKAFMENISRFFQEFIKNLLKDIVFVGNVQKLVEIWMFSEGLYFLRKNKGIE